MNELKQKLREAGLTQKQLAKTLGLSESWVSGMCNDRVSVPKYVDAYLDFYLAVQCTLTPPTGEIK